MISVTLQGRLGNQFYSLAFLLQYAKKHGLEYHIPGYASHCDGNKMYFPHMVTDNQPSYLQDVHEQTIHAIPNGDGTYKYSVPEYKEWDKMDDVRFVGYWQTFEYFDWCRDYILEKFNLRYGINSGKGWVGIHVRRGDFLQLQDKHPLIPTEYYNKSIEHFYKIGIENFYIFSDDVNYCKDIFTDDKYTFAFSDSKSEIEDLQSLANCEHQILCYSTFGFIAAWLNRNQDKQVLIPESKYCFSGAHQDFIPSTFIQIPC